MSGRRADGKSRQQISRSKRAAAAALTEMGVPVRQVARELGISKSSVSTCANDPTLDEAEVERVKSKIAGRFVVASDRFLTHSLDNLKDLHPYQAMLCAGIAHDHYLRSTAASKGAGSSNLTQILVLIDQRTTSSPTPPDDTAT